METLETLRKILRRMVADRFVKEALAMVDNGEMPDATLLRRCGIRSEGEDCIV